MLTEVINKIELRATVPHVFEAEKIVSEVWRSDVSFERGRNYLIEAGSGTGKSSLCSYIYGSRNDFHGTILFDGVDVRGFNVDKWQQLRRSSIAYLPQELSLFPEMTALQNVELKNKLTGYASEKQIAEWFEELGISKRMHYPVGKMSIGQQQRVAIIRALCQPFSFIMLDEPVSHLDDVNNEISANIIMREAEKQGASVIATSVGNNIKIKFDRVFRL